MYFFIIRCLWNSLTAVIRNAGHGSGSMMEQLLVCTGQHGQQSRNQTRVTKTFTNDSWQETNKQHQNKLRPAAVKPGLNTLEGEICGDNSHSLASSATSLAMSRVRGPLCLRDRARTGRIPLITTCSAAPLSGHRWNHTRKARKRRVSATCPPLLDYGDLLYMHQSHDMWLVHIQYIPIIRWLMHLRIPSQHHCFAFHSSNGIRRSDATRKVLCFPKRNELTPLLDVDQHRVQMWF